MKLFWIMAREAVRITINNHNSGCHLSTGKLKEYLFDWKHLTSDLEISQTVSSLPIELTDELTQTHHHNCSQPHQLVIDNEKEKLC